jgi:hypothetical protein
VSGETWPQPLRQTGVSTCRNSKGGWDDKSLNKCHTAARKYFLLALFQIPTGEEEDADLGENERPAKQITRAVRTVAPAPKNRLTERAIAARVAQAWEPRHSEPFNASEREKERVAALRRYDERNPPPGYDETAQAAKALNRRLHPMNDELPGDLGPPKLDTTERDGVPAFLDRRKANGAAEATFVDLVGGADA